MLKLELPIFLAIIFIAVVLICVVCGVFVCKYVIKDISGKKRRKNYNKIYNEIIKQLNFECKSTYSLEEIIKFSNKCTYISSSTSEKIKFLVIKFYGAYIEKNGIDSALQNENYEIVARCLNEEYDNKIQADSVKSDFFETLLTAIVKEKYDLPTSICKQFDDLSSKWIKSSLKKISDNKYHFSDLKRKIKSLEKDFDSLVRLENSKEKFNNDKEELKRVIDTSFPYIFG